MAMPPLNGDGVLPVGVHVCTVAEIRARFGEFAGSDRRPRLFARLEELVKLLRDSNLFEAIIVDGSFVTAKRDPNDIDAIAILRRGHNFEHELSMAEYSVLSRHVLRRRFNFDVVIAETGSHLIDTYIEFFSRVRDNPGIRKGMLKVIL